MTLHKALDPDDNPVAGETAHNERSPGTVPRKKPTHRKTIPDMPESDPVVVGAEVSDETRHMPTAAEPFVEKIPLPPIDQIREVAASKVALVFIVGVVVTHLLCVFIDVPMEKVYFIYGAEGAGLAWIFSHYFRSNGKRKRK